MLLPPEKMLNPRGHPVVQFETSETSNVSEAAAGQRSKCLDSALPQFLAAESGENFDFLQSFQDPIPTII